MKNQKLKSYLYGLRKGLPIFVGFLPVAIFFSILAAECSMTAAETVGMSMAVFAGASQIMAAQMLAENGSMLAIITTTFVLNLRHIIMSTCVFKKMKKSNIFIRILCAFGVTDETFALFTTEDDEKSDGMFMLGLVTVTYLSWIIGTVIGVFIQNALPESLSQSFGIALYALFLALIVPDVIKSLKLFITVLVTVGMNILLTQIADSSWSIIISTLVGAAIGTLLIEGNPFSGKNKGGEEKQT